MDQSELIQLMTEREELYKFQARVYRREVDQTLLDTIKTWKFSPIPRTCRRHSE